MAPDPHGFNGLLGMFRNVYESKWDKLFEKNPKEWIAFKPALGLYVYPCYSCRHMFYSKKSFLDHVNRRAIVLTYRCFDCNNEDLTFYNRCSFLLHCRKHFGLDKGQINLNNLQVSVLPLSLAGFSRNPHIPYLFDVEEELIEDNAFMNAQFYSPKKDDRGKEIITFTSSHLVINRGQQNSTNQALALKQICKNIPKCQFISLQALKEMSAQMHAQNENLPVEVKSEPEGSQSDQVTFSEEPVTASLSPHQPLRSSVGNTIHRTPTADLEELVLPVITKVETVDEPLGHATSTHIGGSSTTESIASTSPSSLTHKCPECHMEVCEPMNSHFLGGNKPSTEKFRCQSCKLICPTSCSFLAHTRVHDGLPPFVCPDCGVEFLNVDQLITHMDEICFHMAKSVRIRCPGRRCGKIFASDSTFGPHFKQTHIITMYLCGSCKEVFPRLEDCEEHCLCHDEDNTNILKLFSCSTCGEDQMNWQQLSKHLISHCKDLSRCIYVYMCKFCKCYFRSVQTMGNHLQNCKVQKTGIPRSRPRTSNTGASHSKYASRQCKLCNSKMICHRSRLSLYCNKCSESFPKPTCVMKKPHGQGSDKCVCILCKMQIDFDDRRRHQQECKFGKPQVLVERFDVNKVKDTMNDSDPRRDSSSNSDLDGSPQKNSGESSDDNRPRKRHKPSKPKRLDLENDLTAEEPMRFDGTYQCCFCFYKNTQRKDFHEHIKIHRHISTAYQCMECGECFVVKPSLVKHLLHFHNISNSERYFLENDCFDHGAVLELAKVVKAPFLGKNVKENQCRVCLEQFSNAEEHDKHFRIHGMAFLMKNSI